MTLSCSRVGGGERDRRQEDRGKENKITRKHVITKSDLKFLHVPLPTMREKVRQVSTHSFLPSFFKGKHFCQFTVLEGQISQSTESEPGGFALVQ